MPADTVWKSTQNSLDIKSSAGDSAHRASDDQQTTFIADKMLSVCRQQRAMLLLNGTQQHPTTILQRTVQSGHQPTWQLMCQ